jgi:alpha-N-acetylglucosaminidase
MFVKIGTAFINEYTKEFGTDHLYNCDTFNEMTPESNSTSYLASAGRGVFSGMATADPKAIWVMQGWLFLADFNFWKNEQVKALVTSVPKVSFLFCDSISLTRVTLLCP